MERDRSFRAVIFDMDGVIVDNTDHHKKAWEIFCLGEGISDRYNHTDLFGKTNRDHFLYLYPEGIEESEVTRLSEKKEAIYRDIYREVMQPVRGLVTFLEDLARNDIVIAVATSAIRANVDFVLDGLAIAHYFALQVDESHVKRGKPDPEVYSRTAMLLNLPPSQCVVMEDSIHGVEAARKAGMHVIGINTGKDPGKLELATAIVDDFEGMTTEWINKTILK